MVCIDLHKDRWENFNDVGMIDTIYACQDICDDIKMGIRSTAILFGSWIRPVLMLFATIFVSMLGVTGYLNEQGPLYFIISVGGTAAHLIWQFSTVDLEIPSSCWSEWTEFYCVYQLTLAHRKLQSQRPTWLGRLDWPHTWLSIQIRTLSFLLLIFRYDFVTFLLYYLLNLAGDWSFIYVSVPICIWTTWIFMICTRLLFMENFWTLRDLNHSIRDFLDIVSERSEYCIR